LLLAIPAVLAACAAAPGTAPARTGALAAAPIAGQASPGSTAATDSGQLAGCPIFPASNIWNTDISKLPVDSHSAAWLRSMNSGSTYLHPDFGPNPGGYPYGIPYTVVTSSHPLVTVHFRYSSESDPGPYPFGPDTRIEGGQNAGGDRHALMLDSSNCTLYELYDARFGSRPTAGSGAIWNLRSNKLRPAGWTSADAAGLPILAGSGVRRFRARAGHSGCPASQGGRAARRHDASLAHDVGGVLVVAQPAVGRRAQPS
jgi:hypothetical protein